MEWQQYILQVVELLFLGVGSYFDVKSRELPLLFLGGFGLLGIFFNVIWKYQKLEMILGGVFLGGLFLLIGKVSKEAVGYGDGLCFMVLGVFEGWKSMITILCISFLLSAVYGVWKLVWREAKVNDTMPFLPFLLLARIGELIL